MLISMVLLMAAAGALAQSTPPKVCSIPLLQARPAPAVDPAMAIAPKAGVRFQIREVIRLLRFAAPT